MFFLRIVKIFENLKKLAIPALILFCLIIRFKGLFIDELLPGWDTLPHFYAFRAFVENLKDFSFSSYNINWLGGLPLFYFYGFFSYILPAILYFFSFGILSEELSWRLGIFCIITLYPISFWFFAKTFIGKKAAKIAPFLSLFFLFFPHFFSAFGIGAESVYAAGLFSGFFSIILLLFFLSVLERARRTHNTIYIYIGALLLGALAINHVLSFFWAIFTWFIFFIYHRKDLWIKIAQIKIAIFSGLISSFFIIPFLKNISLTAAAAGGTLTQEIILMIAIPVIGALHYLSGIATHPEAVILFLGTSLLITVFVFIGIKRFHERTNNTLIFWIVTSFFIFMMGSSILMNFFPNLTLHYYRSAPFLLTFLLLFSLTGFELYIGKSNVSRIKKFLVTSFFSLILFLFGIFSSFNMLPLSAPIQKDPLNFSDLPYHFSLSDYPDYKATQDVLHFFSSLHTQRVFVEGASYDNARQGSPHTLATLLLLKQNKGTLNGLFVESSPQSPFIMPLMKTLTNSFSWGKTPLSYDSFFLNQEHKYMLDRLKLFGVDYIVTYSENASKRMKESKKLDVIKEFQREEEDQYLYNAYNIFKVKNQLPLVRDAGNTIGLYINCSSKTIEDFTSFSLNLFRIQTLYKLPVASRMCGEEFTRDEINRFSFLILNSETILSEEFSRIRNIASMLDKKVFILDASPEIERKLFNNEIKVTPSYVQSKNGILNVLESLYATSTQDYNIEPPQKWSITNSEISFISGKSEARPYIINLGYFPNWKDINKKTVYMVTPMQMLVFSDPTREETKLIFQHSILENILGAISLGTFGLLLILIFKKIFPKKTKIEETKNNNSSDNIFV